MPLYSFYRIISKEYVEGDDEYIGSTVQPLYKRFHQHKTDYKTGRSRCSSKKLFERFGVENCIIVLISQLDCDTFAHARMEERRIYEERKATIINVKRPYVSLEEQKEYYEANKEELRAKQKKYRDANKEKNSARNKAYYAKKKLATTLENGNSPQ